MPTVAERVAEHQHRFGHGEFERERYGVAEPDAVAELVDAFVREQLEVGVAGGIFYAVSIGAVVGVELSDGLGRVVVKLQPEPTSLAHLPRRDRGPTGARARRLPRPAPARGTGRPRPRVRHHRGVPRRWWPD